MVFKRRNQIAATCRWKKRVRRNPDLSKSQSGQSKPEVELSGLSDLEMDKSNESIWYSFDSADSSDSNIDDSDSEDEDDSDSSAGEKSVSSDAESESDDEMVESDQQVDVDKRK